MGIATWQFGSGIEALNEKPLRQTPNPNHTRGELMCLAVCLHQCFLPFKCAAGVVVLTLPDWNHVAAETPLKVIPVSSWRHGHADTSGAIAAKS